VTCFSFSISKPFRKPLWTNYYLAATFLVLFGMSLVTNFDSKKWVNNMFDFESDPEPVPIEYRYVIAITAVVNSLVTYFYEKVVIWYLSLFWKKREDKKA